MFNVLPHALLDRCQVHAFLTRVQQAMQYGLGLALTYGGPLRFLAGKPRLKPIKPMKGTKRGRIALFR